MTRHRPLTPGGWSLMMMVIILVSVASYCASTIRLARHTRSGYSLWLDEGLRRVSELREPHDNACCWSVCRPLRCLHSRWLLDG